MERTTRRIRSQVSREDCWNHEAQIPLLLVVYGLQMLKSMNRNGETSASSSSRLRQTFGQQMSTAFGNMSQQVCKTQKPWQKGPGPGHTWLVPLALRILPAPATCQSSCQVRETWVRGMYCPVTAKEIPTYTRFIGNVDLLNLRQGGWGRDLS